MANIIPFIEKKYVPAVYIGIMGIKVQVATVVVTCTIAASIFAGYFGGIRYEKTKKKPLYLMEKASIYVDAPQTFEAKVRNVAKLLEVPPEWLMAVMYSESRFNAKVENFRGSGAVGLIQFMPATAKDMGTTTQAIANMSHVEQLEWVWRYLNAYKVKYGNYKSLADFYLAILYPKARTGDMCYTLYAKPSKAYDQNIGLDEDKDGRVTVSDIDKRMERLYPSAYIAGQQGNLNDATTYSKTEENE